MKYDIKIGPSVFMVRSDKSPDELYRQDKHTLESGDTIYGRVWIDSWVVKCPNWENMMNMFSYEGDQIKRDISITDGKRVWRCRGCFASEYVYATGCVHIAIDWIE